MAYAMGAAADSRGACSVGEIQVLVVAFLHDGILIPFMGNQMVGECREAVRGLVPRLE